jgi:pyrimidine operon attenuation protein/uracil phosphoribosyltransferase
MTPPRRPYARRARSTAPPAPGSAPPGAAAGTTPRPTGEITTDPSTRKNILIVNDINNTGNTINNLMEDWRSGCLPNDPTWKDIWNNNVKFAVIYDNVSSKSKVTVDFCGEEIAKSKKERIVFPYENWWA